MDDKTKHRLVGLAVIIAVLMIVTPILIKNSKRHLSRKYVNQPHSIQLKTHAILKTPPLVPPKPLIKPVVKVAASTIESIPTSVSENTIVDPNPVQINPTTAAIAEQHSIVLQQATVKPPIVRRPQLHKPKQVILVKPAKRLVKHVKQLAIKHKPQKLQPTQLHAKTQFVPHYYSKQTATKLKRPARVVVRQTHSQYWIQVASLANFKNAQQLSTRLKAKGYQVYLKNITTPSGEKLLKIMVGNSSGIAQAQQLRHKLAKEMNLNGVVVKDRVA